MHRLRPIAIAALLVGAAVSNAVAQPATAGIVSSPCPRPDPAAEARLKPIDDLFMTPAASPEAFWAEFTKLQTTVLAGDAERNRAQQAADWPNLCRYKAANATLADRPRPRAVFMGDSITDNWMRRSGVVRQRHRRSWHRRPDVAADAGTVPTGCRCAATACRAHHGWHQLRRRQYRPNDARGLPAQHAGDDRPRPRQRHRRRPCRDTAVTEAVLARRSRSTPADSRLERVAGVASRSAAASRSWTTAWCSPIRTAACAPISATMACTRIGWATHACVRWPSAQSPRRSSELTPP